MGGWEDGRTGEWHDNGKRMGGWGKCGQKEPHCIK